MGKKATGRIYRTVNFYSISKELKLQILRLKMLYLVVREGLKVQTHLAACCCNTFAATSGNLLWKSLSPWQNFFATTSLTNSDWFDFMQRVAGTKFLVETKIFTKTPSTQEAICCCDMSSQTVAFIMCCSDMSASALWP